MSIETLPGITRHHVKRRIDLVKLLLIIEIEIKEGIAAKFINLITGSCTILDVFVPLCRRVLLEEVILIRLAHVITEIQVGT